LHRFLYPPSRAFYSRQPALEWYREASLLWDSESPSANKPLQCMQHAGDIIYVPRDWGHGVLNVQSTVGVRTHTRAHTHSLSPNGVRHPHHASIATGKRGRLHSLLSFTFILRPQVATEFTSFMLRY
jgi:hypothetical protein